LENEKNRPEQEGSRQSTLITEQSFITTGYRWCIRQDLNLQPSDPKTVFIFEGFRCPPRIIITARYSANVHRRFLTLKIWGAKTF